MTPQNNIIRHSIEEAQRRQSEEYYDRKHCNYYPLMALGMVLAFWLLFIWAVLWVGSKIF